MIEWMDFFFKLCKSSDNPVNMMFHPCNTPVSPIKHPFNTYITHLEHRGITPLITRVTPCYDPVKNI